MLKKRNGVVKSYWWDREKFIIYWENHHAIQP